MLGRLDPMADCLAGRRIPCSPSFFNPTPGNGSQLACLRCPEHSFTDHDAASSADHCMCAGVFEKRRIDGASSCVCPAGYGLVRSGGSEMCQQCAVGTWKATAGNQKCSDCPLLTMVTFEPGAVNEAQCVCEQGR